MNIQKNLSKKLKKILMSADIQINDNAVNLEDDNDKATKQNGVETEHQNLVE